MSEILERLNKSPEDWDVRIVAIENSIRSGDLEGAKCLVRDSPPDLPTPPEIQVRLHTLLTEGIPNDTPAGESLATSENEHQDSDFSDDDPDFLEEEDEIISEEEIGQVDSSSESAEVVKEDRIELKTEGNYPGKELSGGLSALIEKKPPVTSIGSSSAMPKEDDRADAVTVCRQEESSVWEDYDGGLNLVSGDLPMASRRMSLSADRLSSLTMAVVVHLIVFLLVGLVVVNVPPPKPPQLVVSIINERVAELDITRLTKPTPEIKPSAAAARPVDLLSSVAGSAFTIPEVDDTDNLLFNSMVTGLQDVGQGMSFSTNTGDASDVNFFGISGSGKKIVFVIDATANMLVDEKGGMTAYNKVKDEVGIMLANLNRATQFNILLYDGKELVAFREKLVPGLPSNLRMAIDWLEPLNRSYDAIGTRWQYGQSLEVEGHESLPILPQDVGHYTKAIQKAMEWNASSVFCIASGYRRMNRSLTPEMVKKKQANPGDPGEVNPRDQERWQKAVVETRAWLQKENAARREKGVDQKVVTNFDQLVREVTGVSRPQRTGGNNPYRMPQVKPDEIEEQIKLLVKYEYKEEGLDEPSIHMVLFLGDDERIEGEEDHFKNLTRKNRGKLKILRGLGALENVTER